MERRFVAVVVAGLTNVLVLGACDAWDDSARGAIAGPDRWVIEEELRVGQLDGPMEYTFGRIRTVLPGPDGGFWVLDSQVPELRLFDPSGEHVRSVGRRGEGPGEFAGNICAFPAPNGEVWVEDGGRRWQRFDGEGSLLGSVPVTSNIGCGIRVWTTDGRFFAANSLRTAPPPDPGRSFFIEHHLTREGTLVPADTFFMPDLAPVPTVQWYDPGGATGTFRSIPFTHRPAWHLGWSGSVWFAPGGGEYVIQLRTLTGELLATIERAFIPLAIPDSVFDRSVREFQPEGMVARGGFSIAQVPRVYPPFDRIEEATDGKLWVWRQTANDGIELDVFSPEGEYLGAADVPDDFGRMTVSHITGEHMYAVARDELDLPYAVRLAIRPPSWRP